MEWVIIAAAFAAAGYMIYRSRKSKKGTGNIRDHRGGNDAQR
jgi:hypothetical protein